AARARKRCAESDFGSGGVCSARGKKGIRWRALGLRIDCPMKRPYRFIISFDVFVAGTVFLKARKLDFSVVFEARQGISESLKRLASQNAVTAGVPHLHEMAIERVKGA